ncbi:hypothetical protein [Halopelagius fulvigenes]|uniref:Uncharacterized protein n=1 Tax=Halopelagius fulvigenes TaxID=1198324 RepID=A0ABD5TTG9_9EURY
MTRRRSRRSLEKAVEDLEADTPDKLGGTRHLSVGSRPRRRGDRRRPAEFFDLVQEWTPEIREIHDTITDQFPSLAHVSPAEAFSLSYMPEEVTEVVLELLMRDPPTPSRRSFGTTRTTTAVSDAVTDLSTFYATE